MSSDSSGLHAVILAAGASTRFGAPKQLARVNGVPMLQVIVQRAMECVGRAVTVVLGAHATQISAELRHSSASIELNPDWQEGLASSIRVGVSRLPGRCDGVLLLLGDQLGVSSDDLASLRDVWRKQPQCMVAAQYGDIIGVPAIFPHGGLAQLMSLRGDVGAQAVLRANPDRVLRVAMQRAALDVDTPADLVSAVDWPASIA